MVEQLTRHRLDGESGGGESPGRALPGALQPRVAREEVGAQPAAGAVGDHDQVGLDVRERDVSGVRGLLLFRSQAGRGRHLGEWDVSRWRGRLVFRSLPADRRSHVYVPAGRCADGEADAPAVVVHRLDRRAGAHGARGERGGEQLDRLVRSLPGLATAAG